MECEGGVTRSIIDELHSWDVEGDQMAGEIGVTRIIIDKLRSWDIEGGQMVGESMVFLEISLMNFILGLSKQIKCKVEA